eukprot:7389613-Prymnesium_polylepis.1
MTSSTTGDNTLCSAGAVSGSMAMSVVGWWACRCLDQPCTAVCSCARAISDCASSASRRWKRWTAHSGPGSKVPEGSAGSHSVVCGELNAMRRVRQIVGPWRRKVWSANLQGTGSTRAGESTRKHHSDSRR